MMTKSLSQFLTEARTSKAADQAKKLRLKGDGHGGWYDKDGEFVAKTEKGQLKFFDVDIPKIKSNEIITDIIDEECRYRWIGHH